MDKAFHIILIDTDTHFLKNFEEAYHKANFPIHWQFTYQSQVPDSSAQVPVHCLLLDVQLAASNTTAFIENLKKLYYPEEVILILFGLPGQEDILLAGLKAGAQAFLYKKPLNMAWVQFTIENAYKQIEQQNNHNDQLQLLIENNQALEQYKLFIENQLTDRTSELSNTYEQLLEALAVRKKLEEALNNSIKELDTFVYRASHDLRGPIASLIGLTNLAKVEIKDENAQKYLKMITENSNKLNNILTTLLEVTKIKYIDIEVGVVDFYEITKRLRYTYMKDFMRLSIAFDIHIDIPIDFYSDAALIKSILQHLIDNSIQYADVERASWIKLRFTLEEDALCMMVSDNGQGIAKRVQPKIFSMFFKHNATGKGAGIGLYVVKNCVEKLEGRITFTSESDKGTAFKIILPNLTTREKSSIT